MDLFCRSRKWNFDLFELERFFKLPLYICVSKKPVMIGFFEDGA
jgi:hypothetical protein